MAILKRMGMKIILVSEMSGTKRRPWVRLRSQRRRIEGYTRLVLEKLKCFYRSLRLKELDVTIISMELYAQPSCFKVAASLHQYFGISVILRCQ